MVRQVTAAQPAVPAGVVPRRRTAAHRASALAPPCATPVKPARAGAAAQLPPPERTGTKVNTGHHVHKPVREAVAGTTVIMTAQTTPPD
jgi:hypothetical protein